MGIFFRVAVSVMHAMQNSIGPGIQKGGALGYKCQHIKELLPELVHFKHLVRRIPVEEESL
jgi:hypothetical protein